MRGQRRLKLGLIGDRIASSRAPELHRLAAGMAGIAISYELLVPPALGRPFDRVLEDCAAGGYAGVNVTLPYKERAAARVAIADERVRAIAAVNTVVFTERGPQGHNTDYTGFVSGYRRVMGDARPGTVCLIGAGGAGKAVAFGLLALGAAALRIVERDLARAEGLRRALNAAAPGLPVEVTADHAAGARGAHGLVNCTPVGMDGRGGTPLHPALMAGAGWAFDAVYTPVDTRFLRDAAAAGLAVVSGFELFLHQGVDAFRIFTGLDADETRLRRALRC